MSDPNTTLRMAAYPQLEREQHEAYARMVTSQKPTLMGIPLRTVDIEGLTFDAVPTHPALDLELAYYRTLSAEAPAEPPLVFDDPLSHESTTQWQRPVYEPTELLGPEPEPELDLDVDVEAPATSAEWARRFRPVSVRPPAAVAAPRRWPLFVAAALSGGALGFGVWIGIQALTNGGL